MTTSLPPPCLVDPSQFFLDLFGSVPTASQVVVTPETVKAADRATNFHSFRHSATDAFRRAGYLDHEVGFLLGHTSQATKITRGYGSEKEGDIKRRAKMIAEIRYEEFSSLKLTQKWGTA